MGGLGAAALGQGVATAKAAAKPRKGSDRVTLGRCKLQPTLLGIGTGTNGGRQQLGLGQNGFTALVRHALDRGIGYIDTADMYSTHLFVRFALQGVPRDKYFIQTKTRALHPEVAKADIDRFRRELKVDRIDSLLMHCMTKSSWPTDMRPIMDVLQGAKHKGRVGAVGISCHGWEPLVVSPACDWIDVQLARINPFGAVMDAKPEQVAGVLKKLHDSGRGVLGMKIYGESGFDSREKRLESLKYVLGLGSVDAFTIGFVSPKQIDETLQLIEQATA
jgi:predicted aldo/keto reductase-like oxidoreductase